MIYPAMFTQLVSRIGFGWATRVIAFVFLITSIPVMLMRTKTKPTTSRSLFDWGALSDLPYMLLNLGLVFGVMGMYSIMTYIQLFALSRTNISSSLADNLLLIINSGSFVGRVVLGYFADRTGSVNMQSVLALVCAILAFCLLAVETPAGLLVFAVVFGVASGAFMGLPVASIVKMSDDPHKIGTRIGMTLLFVGIGSLISYPIGGAIIGNDSSTEKNWIGLVVYSGTLLAGSAGALVAGRIVKVGGGWNKRL